MWFLRLLGLLMCRQPMIIAVLTLSTQHTIALTIRAKRSKVFDQDDNDLFWCYVSIKI